MSSWQILLLLAGLAWGVQIFGTWRQMMHYADVMKGVTQTRRSGLLGTGNARGRLGRGMICILILDPETPHGVSDYLEMTGRSVFARFRRVTRFDGLSRADLLALLEQEAAAKAPDAGARLTAVTAALAQIDRVLQGPPAETDTDTTAEADPVPADASPSRRQQAAGSPPGRHLTHEA